MTAHVAPTGVAKTLPSGRIVPVEVAACVPCQWQSPTLPLSLFGWRAADEAERHNRVVHGIGPERDVDSGYVEPNLHTLRETPGQAARDLEAAMQAEIAQAVGQAAADERSAP